MRFYNVVLTVPPASAINHFSAAPGTMVAQYTSLVGGKFDPGALNIEFDCEVGQFGTPTGDSGAWLRIWGVSLQTISNAPNFNGLLISVQGGMSAGLPLAKPGQQGPLFSGIVQQCFANWRGTFQCLEFIIRPYVTPINITFNWLQGQALGPSLTTALTNAVSGQGYKVAPITVNAGLVAPRNIPHTSTDLVSFSAWLRQATAAIVGPTAGGNAYAGVGVYARGNTIYATDATQSNSPFQLDFTDLVGQPTWIQSPAVQIVTVLRGDLYIGQIIKMPPTLYTTSPASQSQARQSSAQQGNFQISKMRHVGNFRSSEGTSWVTTINANPWNAAAA